VQTVDVGNSSVGVASWRGESATLRRFSSPEQAAASLTGPAWVISVQAERLACLAAAAPPEAQLTLLEGAPLPLADPRLEHSAGADRVAAALALLPGPGIALDAGTAVTLDLISADGVYQGGFIAPGPAAALAGLASKAPALPLLPGDPCAIAPGGETVAALSAGAWGLVVGGLDRLVLAAREHLGHDAPVRATGGWAEAWVSASALDGLLLDPLLVHRGIRRWAEHGC